MPGKKDKNTSGHFDHLNEEDRALWQRVSDTVDPFDRRGEQPTHARKIKTTKPNTPVFKNHKKPVEKVAATAPSYTPTAQPAYKAAAIVAPNTSVDRRTQRKLGRGLMEIDARLDLHGKTRAQAHRILKSFIHGAHARGNRTVLVITGKGEQGIARHTLHSHNVEHTPERQGVLMRSVPEWLNEPDLASVVVGYQPAHPKHGGGGALYIRIRRIR